jgi:F-type H+-transporting ATPase subunit epsilon
MATNFMLQIVTPERVLLEREVASIVVPAYDGYLGVMANHAPLVAELKIGAIAATNPDGERQLLAVTGGILAVSDNVATVLADAAELASEINLDRAEEARERAAERIQVARESGPTSGVDVDRARAALTRATNRLRVAGKRP